MNYFDRRWCSLWNPGLEDVRWGRDPIVMFGFLIHAISFFLIFLNLPNAAPFGDTDEAAFINSK